MRKRKCILIESDSSSDETFEDGKNASQTSETLMGKKTHAHCCGRHFIVQMSRM